MAPAAPSEFFMYDMRMIKAVQRQIVCLSCATRLHLASQIWLLEAVLKVNTVSGGVADSRAFERVQHVLCVLYVRPGIRKAAALDSRVRYIPQCSPCGTMIV